MRFGQVLLNEGGLIKARGISYSLSGSLGDTLGCMEKVGFVSFLTPCLRDTPCLGSQPASQCPLEIPFSQHTGEKRGRVAAPLMCMGVGCCELNTQIIKSLNIMSVVGNSHVGQWVLFSLLKGVALSMCVLLCTRPFVRREKGLRLS